MRAIATDRVAWLVWVSVGHVRESCKTGSTHQDAVWGLTHMGPKKHVLDGSRSDESIRSPSRGVTKRRCSRSSKLLNYLLFF